MRYLAGALRHCPFLCHVIELDLIIMVAEINNNVPDVVYLFTHYIHIFE